MQMNCNAGPAITDKLFTCINCSELIVLYGLDVDTCKVEPKYVNINSLFEYININKAIENVDGLFKHYNFKDFFLQTQQHNSFGGFK